METYNTGSRRPLGQGVYYAHLNALANPQHVKSLIDFFESGIKPADQQSLGIEIEHQVVFNADCADGLADTAVPYLGRHGVEALLRQVAPLYNQAREYWHDDHLLGLARPGIAISLEPGAQLECSLGPAKDSAELTRLYQAFRADVDPVLAAFGARLTALGYQERSTVADIKLIPKPRYASMNEYLGRAGSFGPCMMRCSASTQVSIDYCSEADAVNKLQLATAIGPILAYFFRNTPVFEGRSNPLPLLRQKMWDNLDPQRTGLIPGLFSEGFGWEDYARDLLETPLMTADLTGTPEYDGPAGCAVFTAWHENAGEVYPDRPLNAYEINHIVSTHFNDVRLKNFLELRHWDSLPIERAAALTDLVAGLFYESARLGQLTDRLAGLGEEDVLLAKQDLQARGAQAEPYGRGLDQWAELLGVTDSLRQLPGDSRHPELVQD